MTHNKQAASSCKARNVGRCEVRRTSVQRPLLGPPSLVQWWTATARIPQSDRHFVERKLYATKCINSRHNISGSSGAKSSSSAVTTSTAKKIKKIVATPCRLDNTSGIIHRPLPPPPPYSTLHPTLNCPLTHVCTHNTHLVHLLDISLERLRGRRNG